jgi:hypothetical protein
MKFRLTLAVVAVAAATSPALAQSFYIVQDTATKRCTIVDTKPTTQTTVVVGNGKVYTSRTEAESAIKTITVCKN